jgi:hypothetical protein
MEPDHAFGHETDAKRLDSCLKKRVFTRTSGDPVIRSYRVDKTKAHLTVSLRYIPNLKQLNGFDILTLKA